MNTPVDTNRVEELDEAECRALLATQSVGRLAYVSAGAPMIVPVNFTVFENMIAFRSDPGDKLSHVPLRQVCFEVDGREPTGSAWSVIVHGFARDVTDALSNQFAELRTSRLPSRASFTNPSWLEIDIDRITGRRLTIR